MGRRILITLLTGTLLTWVVLVYRLADQPLEGDVAASAVATTGRPPLPTTAPVQHPFTFTSNEECEGCHEEIFAEWYSDQHSQAWFNRPLLPQDPKRTECTNCHAPKPVLEVGIEALPIIRNQLHHEGVGCIACHVNVDHVEGPSPSADAPCNPRQNTQFTLSVICSSCHAPHGSLDEWRASDWARKGYTCQACHMPLVDAPVVTGGAPRRRRSHRMKSQRDPDFIKDALVLEAEVLKSDPARKQRQRLEIRITNVGAGHNVPGEIFNRELFLKTRVFDGDGQLRLEKRESFKTVRREQRATEPSTQLEPGKVRRFTYDLEPAHGRIKLLVGYKLLLYHADEQALLVDERELEF